MFFWDEDAQRIKEILDHVTSIRSKYHKQPENSSLSIEKIEYMIDNPIWLSDVKAIIEMMIDMGSRLQRIEEHLHPQKPPEKKKAGRPKKNKDLQ